MDQVSQIREKTDIVSLISEYLSLKKAGRNFRTNCPFHNENTPSFIISPERQIWHCFGCQKGGDAFTFLMEYESLEFPEALRILAKKAGIELLQFSALQGLTSKKEKIYRLNSIACHFYHYLLTQHNIGKPALKYLFEKRKINKALIDTFKIGFAPRMGDALTNYLIKKKKYEKEDLQEAGLVSFRGRDISDFFINRIIFSLFDHRGNIVGFSARTMNEDFVGSKYVNTRETLVYHKGDVFFGLDLAKDEIKKENRVFIMEGEFDVISSFGEGVRNAIAIKGSALTENQVNLVARFTQNVSLCFDKDGAGQEAIKRSIPILEKRGLGTTVVVNLDGKDPDEAVKKNPGLFKKALKESIGAYDFLLNKALLAFDKKTIEGKKKIGEEVLPFFSEIQNEIVKEHYLKKLAGELETSFESIEREAQRIKKKDVLTDLNKSQVPQKRTRKEVLEEYLLALVFQYETPGTFSKDLQEILFDFLIQDSAEQKILVTFIDECKNSQNVNTKNFIKKLPPELLSVFNKSFLFPLPKFADDNLYQQEIKKVVDELKILLLKIKIKKTSEYIKEKEKNGKEKDQDLETLKEEFSKLLLVLQKVEPAGLQIKKNR
ncbi:MAG: DNA primase [Candidatus Levybacteria bacterium]|nr:DNA primase [Candidatus Levybacteria bacterium]